MATTRRSTTRYRHWLFHCCSSPASARASRAEQAQRKAEAERAEADDAAVEASALAEQLSLIHI